MGSATSTLFLALSILIALPPGYAFATKGVVQVAFTSTASPTNSTELFQSMVLNVIGVRLNPTAGSVSETDKKWQLIPAPGGISGTNVTGQGRTELAVDLASTQGVAQILNTVKIPPKTYAHIELVLDPQNPGNFVPLCGNAQPRGEGCISYPAKLANPNTPIQVQGTVSFVVPTPTTSLPPTIPLVLNIDPGDRGSADQLGGFGDDRSRDHRRAQHDLFRRSWKSGHGAGQRHGDKPRG